MLLINQLSQNASRCWHVADQSVFVSAASVLVAGLATAVAAATPSAPTILVAATAFAAATFSIYISQIALDAAVTLSSAADSARIREEHKQTQDRNSP